MNNMGLDFSLQASQKQQLSHSQLQSLEILSMSQEEIGQLLQNEYLDNPMMDCRSNDMFSADPAGLRRGYEQTLSYAHTYEDMIEEEDRRSSDFRSKNPDLLKHYILDQLPYHEYTTQWPLYEYLAGCLDENGYFAEDPALVSRETGYSRQEIEDALQVLRRLEPCGIFAKDLKDCLLCQLSAAGKEGTVIWNIVSNYLEEVLPGNIGHISRSLDVSTAQVRKAIEELSRLNPRPLSHMTQEESHYIIPDILVCRNGQEWEIELNDQWVENYQVNDYYLKMMSEVKDEELRKFFLEKLERVRFLLRSITSRRQTLIRITEAVLEKQKGFFENGANLSALTMNELADSLQIHASTVSRAIRGKYIQYPGGIVPFRALFPAPVSKNAADCSAGTIKDRIRELIRTEDKKKPLSDQKLAKRLEEEGIRISRRAVTLYREELGIKSSYDRKAVN